MFHRSGPAEIIRSHQKDDQYIGYIQTLFADVSQAILGTGRWRQELDLLSSLTYFAVTTLSGYQTVGEEYVNILQVDKTLRTLPSLLRRSLMVLSQITAPYFLNKSLTWLETRLQRGHFPSVIPCTRECLLRMIPAVKTSMLLIHRLHLGAFYIHGLFYHLAKRLTGIRYLQVKQSSSPPADIPVFRVIGYLSYVQLLATAAIQGYKLYTEYTNKATDSKMRKEALTQPLSSTYVPSSMRCSLCLEARQNTTATPCGHLFCWTCIHQWCQAKSECPLCREQFSPSRLIYLQNYCDLHIT